MRVIWLILVFPVLLDTNDMYKAGSIRKIEVKNFVTYSHVEMVPGPHLNMIIGPNGTGKSTMVAAIILGLGGNPKVVGRGTKISEYVKHNCDSATINIIIQDQREDRFIKVTREFDKNDRTWWRLDNRKVKPDEVLKCIQKFNIQVNNLCQFLPQDRVQDFAKLNKQELLRETQKALCRFDLIEKQEALINNRFNHKDLIASIETYQKKLQEAQDANAMLEGRVQNFNTKKIYTEKVLHIERKIAWMMFEEVKVQVTDIKKDRNNAQEVYDKFKNEVRPVEQAIDDSRKQITNFQQSNSRLAQVIRNIENTIHSNLEKTDTLKGSIRSVEDDMNVRLSEIEQWDKEIENATNKLQEMRMSHKESQAKCEADDRERQNLTGELKKLVTQQQSFQDKKDEILQAKHDEVRNINSLEHEMNRLENVKHTRLQLLQRQNQDAHKAVCWLRNNKHLFQGEIYEPIMLEVNVLDNRHAKYVENVIPMRDRLAFTCVNKEDMNRLIRYLREGQRLTVNVVYSSDSSNNLNAFQPKVPIEQLRQYGFYTYVNNLFTAPAPIMSYLCKTYQIHNIPVGDHNTNNCYEKLPQTIRQFFSDKYRYSISFSKYSGEKSTRQTEIFSDGGLSLSLDVVRLEKLKGQINDVRKASQNYDMQIESYQSQLGKVSEKINMLRERMKDLQKERQHLQMINSRIHTMERQIEDMKRNKKSPEDIRKQSRDTIRGLVLGMHGIQHTIMSELKKLSDQIIQSSLTSVRIEEFRKKLAYLENKASDNQTRCQEAEETLNKIRDRYAEVMSRAKSLLNKAKTMSSGFTQSDAGFDEFRAEYDRLSDDVQELNAEKDQFVSRIACLNTADDGEMQEYEERLQEIERLQEKIESSNAELEKITTKMDRVQEEWLAPLKELVGEINLKFASAFERMGCAGEISISTGDNDKDFSQYGLCIKVTYRNGEPLQELNRSVQSGGERAVATAAFMLSLQELTPVPFRCVDEINQGMDANNERRIFELIVDVTCQQTSSQYFLITPKLVPHLNYSRNMAVHIVHNGPFVAQDKKWGFSKVCNPLGLQIA
ncbi:structural maintenance of chromosomes protein 5 [Anoplophora glabripennis]|nr:structural maintenance of chromosomes protein 5 [Anoplophora glabripennis]